MYAPKVFRSQVLLPAFDRLQRTLVIPTLLSFVYRTVCQLEDGKRDLYSRKTPFCLQVVLKVSQLILRQETLLSWLAAGERGTGACRKC